MEQVLRPVDQLLRVLFGNAEHVERDVVGQPIAELRDELGRGLRRDRVDELLRARAGVGLLRGDEAAREARPHHAPEQRMARRIHLAEHALLFGDVDDLEAVRVAEGHGIAQDLPAIVPAREVEQIRREADDRRRRAPGARDLVHRLALVVVEEIDPLDFDCARRHRHAPLLPTRTRTPHRPDPRTAPAPARSAGPVILPDEPSRGQPRPVEAPRPGAGYTGAGRITSLREGTTTRLRLLACAGALDSRCAGLRLSARCGLDDAPLPRALPDQGPEARPRAARSEPRMRT